jgi:hypothetical protein
MAGWMISDPLRSSFRSPPSNSVTGLSLLNHGMIASD